MDLALADARVVVTGGASNIGRGIVHGFAREGARILLADRDADQAARVREEALGLGAGAPEVLEIELTTEGAGGRVVGAAVDASWVPRWTPGAGSTSWSTTPGGACRAS